MAGEAWRAIKAHVWVGEAGIGPAGGLAKCLGLICGLNTELDDVYAGFASSSSMSTWVLPDSLSSRTMA